MLMVLGAVGALGACGPSAELVAARNDNASLHRQLQDMTGERDHIREQLDAMTTQNQAMAQRLQALGDNVARLQQEGTATQNELSATQAREAELRRQHEQQEARLATFRNMLSRLRDMISSGQLRVHVVRGRMVIEMSAGILFDSGQAALKSQGQTVLTQVASALAQIHDRDFLVAGYTDNVQLGHGGRYADNWELSAERAVTVVRYLALHGVATEHLGAAGYGDTQPTAPNDTPEHRALNRRVEIVLMPNIEELPDLSSLVDSTSDAPPAHPAPAHPVTAPEHPATAPAHPASGH